MREIAVLFSILMRSFGEQVRTRKIRKGGMLIMSATLRLPTLRWFFNDRVFNASTQLSNLL